jgi:hypothetical protein
MSRVMSTFGQLSKISSPPTILQAGELLCQREMESSERIANFPIVAAKELAIQWPFPTIARVGWTSGERFGLH